MNEDKTACQCGNCRHYDGIGDRLDGVRVVQRVRNHADTRVHCSRVYKYNSTFLPQMRQTPHRGSLDGAGKED